MGVRIFSGTHRITLTFRPSTSRRLRQGVKSPLRGINPGTDAHTRKPQPRSYIGKHHYERTARSWRSLWASDQALESEDEGVYLRRAQRHLHYRPAKDPEDVQRGVQVRHRPHL